MNPERLAELQRQRALVREQLAGLEREIAGPAAPAASSPAPLPPSAESAATADPAAGLEGYRPDPVSAAAAARRGCLLCAAGLLGLFALGLTAIYFFRYRDRPLLMPGPAAPAAPAKTSPPPPQSAAPRH